jgi:cytidylate kinase
MRLIFVHGPAASGKLTVARALSARTGIGLFHNHLVVDALLAAFDFGSEPFMRLREEFWLAVFSESAKAGRSLIFTFAPERSVRPRFIADTIAAVEAHGGAVSFVALTVSEAEQARRLDAASRREFAKLKSPELLRQLQASGAFDFPPLPGPDLTIDTGTTPPEAAASRIAAHFGLA